MSSKECTNTSVHNDKKRHIVKHQYHDHAFDESPVKSKKPRRGPRGGVTTPFPVKLHDLLDKNLHEEIISWQPHGRCFILRKPKEFVTEVMPLYFKQSKLTSFQCQLNLYGFSRLTSGHDKGGYYHELFLRGKDQLCTTMIRMRIKGTRTKAASDPESEPNFYSMPPLSRTAFKPPSSNMMRHGSCSPVNERVKIKTETIEQPSNCDTRQSKFAIQTPLKDEGEASPVCVSTQCSVSSRSASNSPLPYTNIGAPYLPIRMFSNSQATISPRRNNHTSFPIHYYTPQPQEHPLYDKSKFPDPLQDDDALTFEGKEFHYLDVSS